MINIKTGLSSLTNVADERMVAIYARVSTREQAETGYSVRDQEDKILKYLNYIDEAGSVEKKKSYLDKGKSAKDLNRDGMKQMLEDIRKKKLKR